MSEPLSGRCLCGAVEFEIPADGLQASACHCAQCRRWAGGPWTAVPVAREALRFLRGEDCVRWFDSSEFARRGHCAACGSSLFYHAHGLDDYRDQIAVSAGALDPPTGLTTASHIFVGSKGDYYQLPDDGAPRRDTV